MSSKKPTLDLAGPMQGPEQSYKRPQGLDIIGPQCTVTQPRWSTNAATAKNTLQSHDNHNVDFKLLSRPMAFLPTGNSTGWTFSGSQDESERLTSLSIGVPTYRIQSYEENKNNADLRLNLELLEERREIPSLCEEKTQRLSSDNATDADITRSCPQRLMDSALDDGSGLVLEDGGWGYLLPELISRLHVNLGPSLETLHKNEACHLLAGLPTKRLMDRHNNISSS
ncbi:hypothetical protein Tco_0127616 [Tanacetum coccineum]